MPYFSTYLGHISREETRCHISIRQMRDRMKKIRNPALFVPEPQCMRSSLLPFDDFCQCSWLIVHPRHHTADVDELPADMMSFRAGIANLFAPSKKESIFTGIMNMPMKHIAVFIIISPMKRDEVMAHNYMLAAVGEAVFKIFCKCAKRGTQRISRARGLRLRACANAATASAAWPWQVAGEMLKYTYYHLYLEGDFSWKLAL